MNIELRNETKEDHRAVEELTREAFWNVYTPGCSEHYLAHIMRDSELFIPELDFVAVSNGKIIGNIMYMHSMVAEGEDKMYPVITFGPLSVSLKYQNKGIGTQLINRTVELAREMGYPAILIYGDPSFYRRFGFVSAENYGIRNSAGKYAAALQALELSRGALDEISGRFFEGNIYDLNEKDAAEFDRQFPPKEKKHMPSQDRFAEMIKMTHK